MKHKKKHKSNPSLLEALIQSQEHDMSNSNQIKHHRDNKTNRALRAKTA